MGTKIKNLFAFIKSAWVAGPRGKFGLVIVIISIFGFARLFCGEKNLQSFIKNAWYLNKERKELAIAEKQLEQIQHHVYLLQHPNTSPDYIEELGLKTLNLGNPEFKELKY